MKAMVKAVGVAVSVIGLAMMPATGHAAEKVNFILNWIAGGDHAPYYFAKKMGWYEQAGIEINLEQGKGSSVAVQRVSAGVSPIGLADMATALVARGKGGEVVAVMDVYANSPQGLYWLKSSGIKGVKDLVGKKIGNPPGDAARAMWPALAKENGIDPKSVTWVNIDANAKLAALKSHAVDATTSFYNLHHVFKRELGDDMGFLAWRDARLNTYGNAILVYGPYLKEHRDTVAAFVKVTQKAFAACVADPKPCIQALVEGSGGLQFDNELENWYLVEDLMSDEFSRKVALGWFDPERMTHDYELVKTYLGVEKPFDVTTVYTDEFLDKSIKMAK